MKRPLTILLFFALVVSAYSQIPRYSMYKKVAVDTPGGGATYTDDFEARSNAALAGQGDWIALIGAMNVTDYAGDNRVTAGSVGYSAVAYNAVFANNQYSEAVMSSNGGEYLGVVVRATGSDATYCGYSLVRSPAGTFLLDKITNGVATNLATGDAPEYMSAYTLRLEVSGTTLSCYYNGSLITTISDDGMVTDATYGSGKAGIGGYSSGTTISITSWEGGSLP